MPSSWSMGRKHACMHSCRPRPLPPPPPPPPPSGMTRRSPWTPPSQMTRMSLWARCTGPPPRSLGCWGRPGAWPTTRATTRVCPRALDGRGCPPRSPRTAIPRASAASRSSSSCSSGHPAHRRCGSGGQARAGGDGAGGVGV